VESIGWLSERGEKVSNTKNRWLDTGYEFGFSRRRHIFADLGKMYTEFRDLISGELTVSKGLHGVDLPPRIKPKTILRSRTE
jgi:hypothetical protein